MKRASNVTRAAGHTSSTTNAAAPDRAQPGTAPPDTETLCSRGLAS